MIDERTKASLCLHIAYLIKKEWESLIAGHKLFYGVNKRLSGKRRTSSNGKRMRYILRRRRNIGAWLLWTMELWEEPRWQFPFYFWSCNFSCTVCFTSQNLCSPKLDCYDRADLRMILHPFCILSTHRTSTFFLPRRWLWWKHHRDTFVYLLAEHQAIDWTPSLQSSVARHPKFWLIIPYDYVQWSTISDGHSDHTSFICSSVEDFFHEVLSRIAVGVCRSEHLYLGDHLFVREVLVETIGWEYKVFIFGANPVVAEKWIAGDVWWCPLVVDLECPQQGVVPLWLQTVKQRHERRQEE